MSRAVWSLLLLLVLALPLASCFNDDKACPTCPQENSGSISVMVRTYVLPSFPPDTIRLDSALVQLDGGAIKKVLPAHTFQFDRLSRGRHQVLLQRWYTHYGVIESKSTTLLIELDEGERRTIDVHGDFPRITWLPPAVLDRALARWAARPGDRVG